MWKNIANNGKIVCIFVNLLLCLQPENLQLLQIIYKYNTKDCKYYIFKII